MKDRRRLAPVEDDDDDEDADQTFARYVRRTVPHLVGAQFTDHKRAQYWQGLTEPEDGFWFWEQMRRRRHGPMPSLAVTPTWPTNTPADSTWVSGSSDDSAWAEDSTTPSGWTEN